MNIPSAHLTAPPPPVFTIGLREISQLFRGRVVHVRGAYLVPDMDLLVESARPGGHELMALPRHGKQSADAFAKKTPHGTDSIFHPKGGRAE